MPNDGNASTGSKQDASAGGVTVPARLAAEHPVLVDLIVKSESMNNEERRYWLDILPVMTVEQIKQLNDILQNERDQLAAIDLKYAKQIDEVANRQRPLQEIAEHRRNLMGERNLKEDAARAEEAGVAEELLKRMEEI